MSTHTLSVRWESDETVVWSAQSSGWKIMFRLHCRELGCLSGMVNFMQNFIPHLSTATAPLTVLLGNNTDFAWDESTNATYHKFEVYHRWSTELITSILWQANCHVQSAPVHDHDSLDIVCRAENVLAALLSESNATYNENNTRMFPWFWAQKDDDSHSTWMIQNIFSLPFPTQKSSIQFLKHVPYTGFTGNFPFVQCVKFCRFLLELSLKTRHWNCVSSWTSLICKCLNSMPWSPKQVTKQFLFSTLLHDYQVCLRWKHLWRHKPPIFVWGRRSMEGLQILNVSLCSQKVNCFSYLPDKDNGIHPWIEMSGHICIREIALNSTGLGWSLDQHSGVFIRPLVERYSVRNSICTPLTMVYSQSVVLFFFCRSETLKLAEKKGSLGCSTKCQKNCWAWCIFEHLAAVLLPLEMAACGVLFPIPGTESQPWDPHVTPPEWSCI